jgi:hypothetical protein
MRALWTLRGLPEAGDWEKARQNAFAADRNSDFRSRERNFGGGSGSCHRHRITVILASPKLQPTWKQQKPASAAALTNS